MESKKSDLEFSSSYFTSSNSDESLKLELSSVQDISNEAPPGVKTNPESIQFNNEKVINISNETKHCYHKSDFISQTFLDNTNRVSHTTDEHSKSNESTYRENQLSKQSKILTSTIKRNKQDQKEQKEKELFKQTHVAVKSGSEDNSTYLGNEPSYHVVIARYNVSMN